MPRISRRRVLLSATAMLGAQIAPALAQADAIVIGSFSRAIDYAPFIIAREMGWLDEVASSHGKVVKYVEFQTLPSINESLAAGRLDVIFEAEPPAIIAVAADIDLQVVAPGVSLTQEILVHNGSTINRIGDLKGKKIAVPFGSSSHYGLVTLLEKNGVSRNEVAILDMNPQDGKAAFASKQVDAWAIWPPFVEQEQVAATGRTLSDSEIFIQSIVAMRGGFIRDHESTAVDIVRSIRRAQRWIVEDPKDAKDIVQKALGISHDVVELAWPKHNFLPTIGDKELLDIEAKAEFLRNGGFIRRKVNIRGRLYAPIE